MLQSHCYPLDEVTEAGIRRTYYNVFPTLLKAEEFDKVTLYECEEHRFLSGGLSNMMKFDDIFDFMMFNII